MKRKFCLLFFLLIGFYCSLFAQQYTLTLKITTATGENPVGTSVALEHIDYGIIYPKVFLSEDGICTIKNILPGKHLLIIEKEGLAKYEDDNLMITQDTDLDIVLKEAVRTPYALKTEKNHNPHTGQTDILLNWNKETNYFFDDFESYEPFSIEFQPWTGIDGDKAAAARLSGSYPNSGIPQYATVFNPLTITPPVWYEYPVLRPYSGKQYIGFIRTESGTANNDWLISPKIKVGVNNIVRFMAKAGDIYKEQFKVSISVTGTKVEDFKSLTPGNYETVDYKQWKAIQYDLSAYEGKEVYIAVQYVSKACFMLMMDDFYVGPKNIEPAKLQRKICSEVNPSEKFVLYCDNDSITTVTETSYTFKDLSAGSHTLGVKAVYRVSQSDIATVEVDIEDKTCFASATIHVTTNNENISDGILVNYLHRTTGVQTEDIIKDGVSALKSLTKGEYLVNISPEGYEPYSQIISLFKDTVWNVKLKELIIKPYNITVDLLPAAMTERTDAVLKWNQDLGFTDGFENYADFSQSFGEWTTVDGDKMPPYGVSLNGANIEFPGANEPSPCIIFNPKTTLPSMEADGAMLAPEGDKFVAFFSAQQGQSDDWLISPLQKIRDGYVLRFVAKSYTTMYGAEICEIGICTEKDPTTFQALDEIELPDVWTQYEVDLSEYAGEEIYLTIHYKSYDKFLMQMDSFYVGPREESEGDPTVGATYEVWLNGEKKAVTSENWYVFEDLPDGTYTVGIKAIYISGVSEMSEYTFVCNASGIQERKGENIQVYGSENNICLRMSENSCTQIKIYDAAGLLVYDNFAKEQTGQLKGEILSISVTSGIYMVKIIESKKESVYKVMVR